MTWPHTCVHTQPKLDTPPPLTLPHSMSCFVSAGCKPVTSERPEHQTLDPRCVTCFAYLLQGGCRSARHDCRSGLGCTRWSAQGAAGCLSGPTLQGCCSGGMPSHHQCPGGGAGLGACLQLANRCAPGSNCSQTAGCLAAGQFQTESGLDSLAGQHNGCNCTHTAGCLAVGQVQTGSVHVSHAGQHDGSSHVAALHGLWHAGAHSGMGRPSTFTLHTPYM